MLSRLYVSNNSCLLVSVVQSEANFHLNLKIRISPHYHSVWNFDSHDNDDVDYDEEADISYGKDHNGDCDENAVLGTNSMFASMEVLFTRTSVFSSMLCW